ncbi:MAG: HAMP domain-containing protein [bacterium]|nr:MAG: HAMP domain-containing protein [bacterium]
MFKSLRAKFIFLVTVMVTAFVGIGSVFIIIDKRNYLYDSLFKKAELFGLYTPECVAQYYAGYYISQWDLEEFEKLIGEVLAKNKDVIHLLLISPKGKILFDSSELTQGMYKGSKERVVTDNELLAEIKELEKYVNQGVVEPVFGRTVTFKREKVVELLCPVALGDILSSVVVYHVSIESIDKAIAKTTWVILVIAAGFIALGVILSILLANIIIRPIEKAAFIMEEIAEKKGDLTRTLEIKGKDEPARLAMAFNKLVKSMYEIVRMIRSVSNKVAHSSENLSASAQQMNTSTVNISSMIQHVSKGVSKQVDMIQDTSKVLEKISDASKHISENAQLTVKASEQASEVAQKGSILAHQTVEKIKQLNEVIASSADTVKKFAGRSEQISEIVEVLADIADGTNLLALNATIEAARAGESGRGFAVVADEIRKLAEGSSTSAKDIGELVQSIQSDISSTASSMESGMKEIAEGTQIVDRVGEALGDIVDVVQDVSRMVNEIAQSTTQQMNAIEKITFSMSEVSSIAESSAVASGDVTSSTEEQTSSMEDMASSAHELSCMAVELRDLVAKFKL